ncbi:hypothetical protein diail_67 [Diaporthe ilicicola]|nr:hypothetical protein diail_67 [Diaporthe ilicicola]
MLKRGTGTYPRAYQGLSPKARLGVGVGLLGWGVIGLYMSDHAEERFGYTPSDQDKAAMERMKPKIHVVDRDEKL